MSIVRDRNGTIVRDSRGNAINSVPQVFGVNNGAVSTNPLGEIIRPISSTLSSLGQSINTQIRDFRAPQSFSRNAQQVVTDTLGSNGVVNINANGLFARVTQDNSSFGFDNGNAGVVIQDGQLGGLRVGNAGIGFQDGKIQGITAGPLSLGFDGNGNISGGNISAGPLSLSLTEGGLSGGFNKGPLSFQFGPQGITSGSFSAGGITAGFGPGGFGIGGSIGGLNFSIGSGGFSIGLGGSYFGFGGRGPHTVGGNGTGGIDRYQKENPTQVTNPGEGPVEISIDTFLKGSGGAAGLGGLVQGLLGSVAGAALLSNLTGDLLKQVGGLAGPLGDALGKIGDSIGNVVGDFAGGLGDALNGIPGIGPTLTGFGKGIGEFVGEVGDAILSSPVEVQNVIASAFAQKLTGNPITLTNNERGEILAGLQFDTPIGQLAVDMGSATRALVNAASNNNITNTENLLSLTSAAQGFNVVASNNVMSNGRIGVNSNNSIVLDRYGNPVTDSSGNAVTSVG